MEQWNEISFKISEIFTLQSTYLNISVQNWEDPI